MTKKNFKKNITKVEDINLLGSAIFGNWRYYNHWAYSNDEITKPEARAWFIIALNRLAKLTEYKKTMFEFPDKDIEKIELMSNRLCYDPRPKSNEMVQ